MVILLIISLIVTVVVWSNAGPVWGILTGFLLLGGIGWGILAGVLGLAMRPFQPGWGGFVRAWEQRIGDQRRSGWDVPNSEILAMRTAYRTWRRDRGETESAADWLDRQLGMGKWKPEMVRHVALFQDGKGATFELRRENGEPKWTWSYDSGTPDNFATMMLTEQALTKLEKEMNLPLTFPHWDPDKPPEEPRAQTEAEKAEQLRQLERRADEGDPNAQSRLWQLHGRPITQPSELKIGDIYYAGFDLGVYQGSFVGRRYEGDPEIDDEPEVKEWFQFEMAESAEKKPNRYRISLEDFQPRTLNTGDASYPVIELPAEQDEVHEVFEELRAQYQEWDRNRGPERFF